MRTWVGAILLASSASVAAADNTSVRVNVRRLVDAPAEPWLHLDAAMPDLVDAAGGLQDGRAVLLELGPRVRLAAEGTWWQTGLSPSLFAEDLDVHGWRASAELSYDLGWARVGANASIGHLGDGGHRMAGLFAYRTFRLSRWMRAWIMLGASFEQWNVAGSPSPKRGTSVGFTLGTTFR